jgi:hypothetical protein
VEVEESNGDNKGIELPPKPNFSNVSIAATCERLKNVGTSCPYLFGFWIFAFTSPVRRLDQPQGSGGLGEHCSSPAVGRGVCAPPGRVAQPRLLAADRGNRAAAVNRGRLFFGYFILAKQKKVACCRATPGGVDFGFCIHHKVPAASRRCFDIAIRLGYQKTTAKSLVIRANGLCYRATSGNAAGFLMESTAKSTSSSGQYK